MNRERIKTILYWVLPIIGGAFCVWYITKATTDVVYSDYIRLVNSYLPDIYDIRKFLVPDVLTRVPINYLERIINVELFGYSVFFERVPGRLGLWNLLQKPQTEHSLVCPSDGSYVQPE